MVALERRYLDRVLLGELGDLLLVVGLHISPLLLQCFSLSLESFSCHFEVGLQLLDFLLVLFFHEVLVVFEFLLEFFDHLLVLVLLLPELLVSLIILPLLEILEVLAELHFLVFDLLEQLPDLVPQLLLAFGTAALCLLEKVLQLLDLTIQRIDGFEVLLDFIPELLNLVVSLQDRVGGDL